jgi:hypothetical protein
MVQLVVGWDAAAPQPVHNPLLLHSLQRALHDPNISIFMSKAAGERVLHKCVWLRFGAGSCALLAYVELLNLGTTGPPQPVGQGTIISMSFMSKAAGECSGSAATQDACVCASCW